MKTATISLASIKDSDGWSQLAYKLKFEQFQKQHPDLDEDELNDMFYTEIIKPKFVYGEYANLEIVVDENFNIVGGRIC